MISATSFLDGVSPPTVRRHQHSGVICEAKLTRTCLTPGLKSYNADLCIRTKPQQSTWIHAISCDVDSLDRRTLRSNVSIYHDSEN